MNDIKDLRIDNKKESATIKSMLAELLACNSRPPQNYERTQTMDMEMENAENNHPNKHYKKPATAPLGGSEQL